MQNQTQQLEEEINEKHILNGNLKEEKHTLEEIVEERTKELNQYLVELKRNTKRFN